MREKIEIRIDSIMRFYEVIASITREVVVEAYADMVVVTPKDGVTTYIFKPKRPGALEYAIGAAEMLRHINERYPMHEMLISREGA